MISRLLRWSVALFLLMLGAGCATSVPQAVIPECVPEIQLVERYIALPADLTEVHENPLVPKDGTAYDLLEWCLVCAHNTDKLNRQMRMLRELESAQTELPSGIR